MTTQPIGSAGLWKAYRAELLSERLHSLEVAALWVLISIMIAFLIVDAFVHPERFWSLAGVRAGVTASIALTFLALGRSRARLSALLGGMLTSFMLLALIYDTGGPTSNYFAGLMLVFTGVPVLLPLSALETSVALVPSLLGFLISPWVTGIAPTWSLFGLHAFYLGGSATVAIVSAGLLDRGRFAEFRRRREAEQAVDELQELDRAKSRFTANVHHELRTPLTLLLAPLEAMQAGEFGPLSELQQRTLGTMHANASRLLKLLSSVLELAKSEAGEFRLKPRRTDIGAVAARVIEAAQPLAERKGVRLEASGLEALPALSVDRDALDQVLVNLIGNALKFTPGGGRVEVSAMADDDAVEVIVTDTGVGLRPEDLGRVFDRFAQVDDSTTRRFEGAGIGLAITRELVAAHDGAIWAESSGPWKGASFHVQLPRKPNARELEESEPTMGAEADATLARSFAALEAELDLGPDAASCGAAHVSAAAKPATEATDQFGRPATTAPTMSGSADVLVVEDNGGVRRLLARVLEREFHVRTAGDGTEALTAIEARPPDLVLTDVMMPGMSGVDLCRRLKEDERTRGIPVVLLTAKADSDSRIEGLEHGAEEYLPKPFHARELLARVRALVKLRTLQRELAIRNQELEAANAALGTSQRNLALYARAISHDLRSPLAAASEALRLIRGEVAGDRSTLMALAEENLKRADGMLGALRELTRTVGAEETPVSVDADGLLTEVLAELALSRGGAALPIQIVAPLGTIQAPRQKLAHVFRNLLRNAMEALEGVPNPHIEIGQLPAGETGFYVRDNGPGIPYEYQARLFEPFRRGPRARLENMGLGLALVQQLVEQQGGKVSLDSAPGHGTIFRLTFPKDWDPPPETLHGDESVTRKFLSSTNSVKRIITYASATGPARS